MRQWRVTRWSGVQLELLVQEGTCLFEAINNSAKGAYDPDIIKVEEVTTEEESPDGIVPPH